jgi:outer membrane protein assembly factor BamB
VLVCLRHQDSVVLLDWDTKEVLWSWGQGRISGPHDATMLPGGNVLIFDNGLGRDWSRVVEVDPRTDEIVWEYRDPDPTSFYSKTRGSNQRLSNGNTLIGDSDSGRVLEVTPEGEKVWEFMNPNLTPRREPSVVVRMRRYEGLDYDTMREVAAKGELPRVD